MTRGFGGFAVPMLHSPGLCVLLCFIRADAKCCIGYRGFPQGTPHPFSAHPRRERHRVPLCRSRKTLQSDTGNVRCVCTCVIVCALSRQAHQAHFLASFDASASVPSSFNSNSSVEPPGTLPFCFFPYARFGGTTKIRSPPTFIPWMP